MITKPLPPVPSIPSPSPSPSQSSSKLSFPYSLPLQILKFLLVSTGCFVLCNLLTFGFAWERLWPIELRIRLTETAGQYLIRPMDTLDGAAYLTIESRPIAVDLSGSDEDGDYLQTIAEAGINVYYTNRHPIRRPFNEQLSGNAQSQSVLSGKNGDSPVDLEQLLSELIYPLRLRHSGSIRLQFTVDSDDRWGNNDVMLRIYRYPNGEGASSSLPKLFYQSRWRIDDQNNNPRPIEFTGLPQGIYGIKWSRMALGKSWVNWTIDWTTDKWFLTGDVGTSDDFDVNSDINTAVQIGAAGSTDDVDFAYQLTGTTAGDYDEDSPLDICRCDGEEQSLGCVWTRWQSKYLLLEAWKSADVFIRGRYAYPKQLSYDLPQIWLVLLSLLIGYLSAFHRSR